MSRRGERVKNRIRFRERLGLGSMNVLRQCFSKEDGISQTEVHSLSAGRGMDVSGITNEEDDTAFTWLSGAKTGESDISNGSMITETGGRDDVFDTCRFRVGVHRRVRYEAIWSESIDEILDIFLGR